MRHPAVVWPAAVVISIAFAIPGVVLYARDPGVLTHQLNGLLLLPLLGLALYGLHRVLPTAAQWALALAIAPLGGIAYLIWPNDQWWNYGLLTAAPLFILAVLRDERQRSERGDHEPTSAGWADGPWGPP
jgi:hypothetical protein